MGQVVWKSLKAREVTMYDLYIPLVKNPDPAAVIRAEQITGPILLLSSKMGLKDLRQRSAPFKPPIAAAEADQRLAWVAVLLRAEQLSVEAVCFETIDFIFCLF